VLVRQRPSTAKGIVFMTIEDETGVANLILRPQVYARLRQQVRHAVAICVRGKVERRDGVVHVLVSNARDIGAALTRGSDAVSAQSRDFH
jgi:error-prone DNA polymerase